MLSYLSLCYVVSSQNGKMHCINAVMQRWLYAFLDCSTQTQSNPNLVGHGLSAFTVASASLAAMLLCLQFESHIPSRWETRRSLVVFKARIKDFVVLISVAGPISVSHCVNTCLLALLGFKILNSLSVSLSVSSPHRCVRTTCRNLGSLGIWH